jgi:hypothetical protein
MGNFLEDFILGKQNSETGETDGGIPGFLDAIVPDPGTIASDLINETVLGQIATFPIRGPAKIIGKGLEAVEAAESYVLARPASTVLQAIGVSNPLYRDGVQVQDFFSMWNASEYISPGRAGVTNIGSQIGILTAPFSDRGMYSGGADWNEFSYGSGYNPYEMTPEELEEKWDSSALGTIGSTSLDTAFVIVASGKGVNAAASGLKRAAGLGTTIKNARDLTNLRDSFASYRQWMESGGQTGSRNVSGRLVQDLVEETDSSRIMSSDMLDNITRSGSYNRDELSDIISKTDDYDTIAELLLADRGDARAIGQLFQAAPDRVWALSDMNEIMQRQFAAGGQFIPNANEANRIKQVFDTAADRDEFFASVRDMFMRSGDKDGDSGLITSVRGAGSDFVPMGTFGVPVVKDVAGYAQRWVKKTMADARVNRPNTWNEIEIPGQTKRSPKTTLLFWAGGRRPLNVVSYNSMRPTEVVDEMLAYSRSSRSLRKNTFTVTRKDANGISENLAIPSWQWRAEALQQVAESKRLGVTELNETVKRLEDELISVVANRYLVSASETEKVVKGLRVQSDEAQAQVAKTGSWLDNDASRVVIDPVTQSQLADSLVLMPLDDLDSALRSISSKGVGARVARVRGGVTTALDFIYRWFRTNVLFRPGYAPKNSFAEPAVAGLMADASLLTQDGLRKSSGRFIRNNNRRVTQFSYGITDRLPGSGARRDVNRMQILYKQYDDLKLRSDEIDLLVKDLDSAGTNPATRGKYLSSALRERKSLHREIKKFEEEFDLIDDSWRQVEDVPSFSVLSDRYENIRTALTDDDWLISAENRVAELSSKQLDQADEFPIARAAERAELERLESLIRLRKKADESQVDSEKLLNNFQNQLDDIQDSTFLVEQNVLQKQRKLEAEMRALDNQRATLEQSIAARQIAREGARKREFSGNEEFVITSKVDGKEYVVPGIFDETPGMFGSAMRADSAADLTAMQTMTGGTFSGARSGSRWRQSESGDVITPFEERYWEQLAYIANRHTRNDPFAKLILEGKSDSQIMNWFSTPEGKSYRKRMGWSARDLTGKPVKDIKVPRLASDAGKNAAKPTGPEPRITVFDEGIIARTKRLVNDYFPTADIRSRIINGEELTPGELQKTLGSFDNLSPIYGTGLEFVGNTAARVNRAMNNAANKVWSNIAVKPETRSFRWPFMQREYRRQMQREIDLRSQQGIVIDGNMLQSMRVQASSRALKEMENTFYNVRRITNPVYALRYVTGFPAAAWNTVYRYLRLGYKNPGNALVMTNAWTNVLEFSSVDEEGNPTTNWRDAYQIIISVPEEWDLPISPEIKVRAESINLGTQESGVLPTVSVPVSTVLMLKPELDGWMQENMSEIYDAMFPYGPGTDPDLSIGPVPIDPFMASYQKKGITLVRSFFEEIPDEDFLRVVTQDYSYKMFEWAKNNYEGLPPDYNDSISAAQQYYGIGALLSWGMFGSYQLSPEGQFYRDEYYRLLEKHPDNYPAALEEGTSLYGPEFMYLAMPSSKNRAGMPPTQDALAIFNSNPNLLNDLRSIDPKNPQLATQLLFLDEQAYDQEDFSQAVYDWSFNTPLPGDTQPIRSRRSPQEQADEIARSQGWSMYNEATSNRDALKLKYGYNTLSPDNESYWLYEQWNSWLEDFKAGNPVWYADFDERTSEKSLRAVNALDTVLNNKKYMSEFGQTQTWEVIGEYRRELTKVREKYEALNDKEYELSITEVREDFAAQWDEYVRSTYLPEAGNFSGYYERFLAGRDITGDQLLDLEFNIPSLPVPASANTSGVNNE